VSDNAVSNLRPLAPGIVLALFSIGFGFLLGSAFGAVEGPIKDYLGSSADAVLEAVYEGDSEKRDAVVSKSWSYMKRAHLHGGAIGATALASILLMGLFGAPGRVEKAAAAAFGGGALLYALFWLAAGLTAPGIGSTGEAKDALGFIAIPGSGLCMLGLLGTLWSVFRNLVAAPSS
jgi:hypothetical protein